MNGMVNNYFLNHSVHFTKVYITSLKSYRAFKFKRVITSEFTNENSIYGPHEQQLWIVSLNLQYHVDLEDDLEELKVSMTENNIREHILEVILTSYVLKVKNSKLLSTVLGPSLNKCGVYGYLRQQLQLKPCSDQ